MSEQRETWLPWSEVYQAYADGTNMGRRDYAQNECDSLNNNKLFEVADLRPVLIPPPAEIAANARALERCKELAKKYRVLIDNVVDTKDESKHAFHNLVSVVCGMEEILEIDAAMKGGE